MALDKTMYGGKLYSRNAPKPIEDDHIPFAQRGLPVINLIDFENLATWHQPSDSLANLDLSSIEKVSRLATNLVIEIIKEESEK